MKKLLLLSIASVIFIIVDAGCGCNPQYQTDHGSLSGNYTYDSVSHVYFINPGDTVDLYWNSFACSGSDVEYNLNFSSSYVLAVSSWHWKIFGPGNYSAESSCGGMSYGWGFGFTIAFYNTTSVSDLSFPNSPVSFIYSALDKSLEIRTFDLNQSPSQLNIFDLLGREVYHQDIQFKSKNDNVHIDLSNNLFENGLYVVRLQYGQQNFAYKLVNY